MSIGIKWYKVPGYQVEVTKYGDVRDNITKNLRTLYLQRGYKFLGVRKDNGKSTIVGVHRLVALVFCKGYKKGLEVNHIDCNRQNNYYKNLEWITRSENMHHAVRNGYSPGKNLGDVSGENHGISKLDWKKVKLIRKLYATGKCTQVQLSKMFKVCQRTINLIVNYETWKDKSLIA
jgi:hypothetical protein